MNKHAIRVFAIVVILLPFTFSGSVPTASTAQASVSAPYMWHPAPASFIPPPSSETLSSQPFTLSSGLTGWRVRMPDRRALGTPAIGNGHVLIGGGFGSYAFYGFDAYTGQLDWQLKTTDDGPTSAVIEDGIGVYNTESCTVEAVDVDSGKRLWTHKLGDPLMSQPAISKRRVYMVSPAANGRGDSLYCLSLRTGETIWTKPLPADVISAPVIHNDSAYCATIDGSLTRIEAANGIVLWRQAKNATSAPWVDEKGNVSVSQRVVSVNGHARPIGATDRTGGNQVTSEGFASTSGDGRVQSNAVASVPAPYLDIHHNQSISSVNEQKAADGSVGFSTAPESAGMNYANGNLGASSVDEVWSYQGSRPIVTGGRNYNGQDNVAKCIDEKTGRTIWKDTFEQDPSHVRSLTPFSEAGGKLYYGTSGGDIGCIRKSDGARLWSYHVSSAVLFPPSIVNGRIYVTTEDGCLYCLDTHDKTGTGWPMWGGSASHDGPHG